MVGATLGKPDGAEVSAEVGAMLGELDGSRSERVQRLSACFVQAGLKAPVLDDIRAEIWLKLWV